MQNQLSTAAATQRPRLHYFDMIKGIAIFMVVMGHVLTMCVRQIDSASLFKFIEQVHMPLFFFISGWFTYKCTADGRIVLPKLYTRALQLLLPMLVVSTIWIYYFPHSGIESPLNSTFSGLWSDAWKNGYWFTLVLFEIMLLYWVTVPLLQRAKKLCVSAPLLIALWAAALVGVSYIPANIVNISDIGMAVEFYAPFMMGVLAHRHKDGFHRLTEPGAAVTLAILVGGVCMYYCCWPWEFPNVPAWVILPVRALLRFAVAIVAISVVKPWSIEAFGVNAPAGGRPMARMWTYLGRNSLAIYLLHYFFLFPMGCLRPVLVDMHLALTPLVAISMIVAAVVVAITLGANEIISKSPLLALLLTGKTK